MPQENASLASVFDVVVDYDEDAPRIRTLSPPPRNGLSGPRGDGNHRPGPGAGRCAPSWRRGRVRLAGLGASRELPAHRASLGPRCDFGRGGGSKDVAHGARVAPA